MMTKQFYKKEVIQYLYRELKNYIGYGKKIIEIGEALVNCLII